MTQDMNSRWIFDEIRLKNSPSKRDNIGFNEEMHLRQMGTNFIKEMGDYLKLRTICMNTAMVYFHRFFTIRSFKRFNTNEIAVCSLFLSSKFEEQPIIKEHLIQVSLKCRQKTHQKPSEEQYQRECNKLIENENEMLLTFGFDLSVTHSQTVIICASQSKSVINRSICQNAYHIAGDLLRLTTICLQFKPGFIACVCVYLSSHFSDIPIDANWCHLLDSEAKLEDVERVAQNYKCFVNISKIVTDLCDNKISDSFDSSPESAYSSGSGNSPTYDLSKLNTCFTKSMSNQTNNNNKRIRSEKSSTIALPNNSSAVRTASHSTDLQSTNRLKYRKVVKPNGQVVRHNVSSFSSTATPAPNTSQLVANQTKTANNSNKLFKKNLNLKITFTTNNDSKSSDLTKASNSRIVHKTAIIS